MSVDNSRPSKTKALTLGACDYWIKPLHDKQLEDMWIHVFKKYISEDKMQKDIGSMKVEDYNNIREISDNPHFGLSYGSLNESENSNSSSTRKTRIVWSPELHYVFLKAIQELGIENATPKKILEAMKIPGLEKSHVASHLQKYRKEIQQQQNKMSLVSTNIEPRTSAIHLSAAIPTYFHPGLTDNMAQSNLNIQSTDHFQAEQALTHDHPFPDFLNTVITANFPPSTEALVENPTMLHENNMHQSVMMHHNQIQPMNFEPSSFMIYGNPASIPQNSNLGMNMNINSSFDKN